LVSCTVSWHSVARLIGVDMEYLASETAYQAHQAETPERWDDMGALLCKVDCLGQQMLSFHAVVQQIQNNHFRIEEQLQQVRNNQVHIEEQLQQQVDDMSKIIAAQESSMLQVMLSVAHHSSGQCQQPPLALLTENARKRRPGARDRQRGREKAASAVVAATIAEG